MKKILVSLLFLVTAVSSFAQIDSINYPARKMPFGNWDFIWTNGALIDTVKVYPEVGGIGLDTLFFSDGTKQATSATGKYIDRTGDTLGYNLKYQYPGYGFIEVGGISLGRSFISNFQGGYIGADSTVTGGVCTSGILSSRLQPKQLYFTNTEYTTDVRMFRIVKGECSEYDTLYSESGLEIKSTDLIFNAPSTTIDNDLVVNGEINGLTYESDDISRADDESIILTNGVYGWGEVYAFTSTGIIDEWAEFIFSSDGTVYLKSNSTDVSNIDEDGKLCIFDNGTSITIRNRLGGGRTIKYIIHY